MDTRTKMTSRERILRVGGGVALVVVGCVIFSVSKQHDPKNRAALVGIIAVIAGLSLLGQGLRGRRDGPIYRDAPADPGPPVSVERTVAGVFLAWIVPGLGHWLIGRRRKALLYFLTISITFLVGVALAEGRNMNYDRDAVYFLAYMFNAGWCGLGWLATQHLELSHHIPYLQVGFLYAAVACLLNLVAMMDFVAICARSTHPVEIASHADSGEPRP